MKYKRIPFNYDWDEIISLLQDDEDGDGVSLDLDNDILILKSMTEIPWCEFPDDIPMKKTGMWVKDEGDGYVGYYIVYKGKVIYYSEFKEPYDELINESVEEGDYSLTLSTRNGRPLIQYGFYDVEESEVQGIQDLIESEDTDELRRYVMVEKEPSEVRIVFNTYDDKEDFLDYDLEDTKGNEVDSGQFIVLPQNIIRRKKNDFCIINKDYHPNYLLISYDTLHKGQSVFDVPPTIDVHKLKFDDSSLVDETLLWWEWFGERTTNIFTFRYNNKRYQEVDYFDNGSLGEFHFGLFKWTGQRYTCLKQM